MNLLLGLWVLASAFAWPHDELAQTNTWICGLLIALFAILAIYEPTMRYVNTVLGAWLVLSTVFVFEATTATRWNNVLVGLAVFIVSLVPGPRRTWFVEGRPEVHA